MSISFWEQDALCDADFIVIGAGLIGLQVALQIRQRASQARVMVLERGILPSGASTRNAGFACFGSLSEILADVRSMGSDAALALVAKRQQGLVRLRALLGDEAIGYEDAGGHELILRHQRMLLNDVDEVNRLLQPVFGAAVFHPMKEAPGNRGFGDPVDTVLSNAFEGQLHSGMTMRALRALAAAEGVEIINGVEVIRLHEEDRSVRIETAHGIDFRAGQVAVCTNAAIPQLLPGLQIEPARGQILLTAPIPALPWRGAYHMDEGYFYFRNLGDRVLLGGARHLAFSDERSFEMKTSEVIQNALEDVLRKIILPGQEVAIEQRWAGIMGFSPDKQALVRRVGQRRLAAFGCNGMGVALSPMVAQEAADLLLA